MDADQNDDIYADMPILEKETYEMIPMLEDENEVDDIYADMPILEKESYDDIPMPNSSNIQCGGGKKKKTKARFYRDETHRNEMQMNITRQLIGNDPLLEKQLDESKFNREYFICLNAVQMKTGQYRGLYGYLIYKNF